MDQYQNKFRQTEANTLTHNLSTFYTPNPCRYFTPQQHNPAKTMVSNEWKPSHRKTCWYVNSHTVMLICGRHIRENNHIRNYHIRPYMIICGTVCDDRAKAYVNIWMLICEHFFFDHMWTFQCSHMNICSHVNISGVHIWSPYMILMFTYEHWK